MHCKGIAFLLWVFCYVGEGTLVRRNVTLTGLAYDWSAGNVLRLINATVLSDGAVQNVTWECPVGRYCPAGVERPVMCRLGTYSTRRRLASPCPSECPLNSYCPDPAVALPCPNLTASVRGAKSQLDCKCQAGYQCTYKRFVNLNVGLGVPYKTWISPAGDPLRQALLQAVAESAGVPLGSVRVERVMPGIPLSAGGRRLLESSQSAVVSLSVANAEQLHELRERLRAKREFRRRDVRVHWKLMESLRVTKL